MGAPKRVELTRTPRVPLRPVQDSGLCPLAVSRTLVRAREHRRLVCGVAVAPSVLVTVSSQGRERAPFHSSDSPPSSPPSPGDAPLQRQHPTHSPVPPLQQRSRGAPSSRSDTASAPTLGQQRWGCGALPSSASTAPFSNFFFHDSTTIHLSHEPRVGSPWGAFAGADARGVREGRVGVRGRGEL